MPKFEVVINGTKTTNYTYTTIIEAEDYIEAWDKADNIEPEQSAWELVKFDDQSDNEIEVDGVDEIDEVTTTDTKTQALPPLQVLQVPKKSEVFTVPQASRARISYESTKEVKRGE